MLQAAAIDPTRYVNAGAKETEAARHMFVDGVAMKRHHHYNAWRRRANERVPLTKRGQRKLQKVKAPGTDIRVDDLIRLVRHQRIK